jgi:hypothetical protein
VIRFVRQLHNETGNDITPLFPCEEININHDKPHRNEQDQLPYRAMVSQEYQSAHREMHFPDDDGVLGVLSKSLSASLFASEADKAMVLLD